MSHKMTVVRYVLFAQGSAIWVGLASLYLGATLPHLTRVSEVSLGGCQ